MKSIFSTLKRMVSEILTRETLPQEILDCRKNNQVIGVYFVKSDGSLRKMAMKTFIRSYERKTASGFTAQDKQNQIIRGVDLSVYNKELKAALESGLPLIEAQKKASSVSYKSFPLSKVLALKCGKVFDMREENGLTEYELPAKYQRELDAIQMAGEQEAEEIDQIVQDAAEAEGLDID